MERKELEPQKETGSVLEKMSVGSVLELIGISVPEYRAEQQQYSALSTKIRARYGIDSANIGQFLEKQQSTQQEAERLMQEMENMLKQLPPTLALQARDGLREVHHATESLSNLALDAYWMDQLALQQDRFLGEIKNVHSLDGAIEYAKRWKVKEVTHSPLKPEQNFFIPQYRRFFVHRPEGVAVFRLSISTDRTEDTFSLSPEIVLRSTRKNTDVQIPKERFGGVLIEVDNATSTLPSPVPPYKTDIKVENQLLPINAQKFATNPGLFGRAELNILLAEYLSRVKRIGDRGVTADLPTFSREHLRISQTPDAVVVRDQGTNPISIYLIEKLFNT